MSWVVLNLLRFKAAWVACVVGAGQGLALAGAATALALLAWHLSRCPAPRREVLFVLSVAGIGAAVDSAQALAGVFWFHGGWLPAWAVPPWLLVLWTMFASTLRHSLAWLGRSPVLAALAGALAGPASYYAGVKLGAVLMPENPLPSLAILAAVWAVLTPALMRLARHPRFAAEPPRHSQGSNIALTRHTSNGR